MSEHIAYLPAAASHALAAAADLPHGSGAGVRIRGGLRARLGDEIPAYVSSA